MNPGAYLGVALLVLQVVVKRACLRRGRLGVAVGVLHALVWAPFLTFPYLYNPVD